MLLKLPNDEWVNVYQVTFIDVTEYGSRWLARVHCGREHRSLIYCDTNAEASEVCDEIAKDMNRCLYEEPPGAS